MVLLKIHSLHSYIQEYYLDYNHKCINSLHFFAQVQYLIIVTVLVSIYTLVLMSIDRWGHQSIVLGQEEHKLLLLGFKINWAGIIARQRVCFPHIRQCRHLFTCAEPALQSNTKSQCCFACVCALRLSLPQGHSQYCTVVTRDCFSEEIWLIGKGKKTWLVAAWPRKTEVVGG